MSIAKRPKQVNVSPGSGVGKGAKNTDGDKMVQRAGVDPCLAQLDDFESACLGTAAQTVNEGGEQRAEGNRVRDNAGA